MDSTERGGGGAHHTVKQRLGRPNLSGADMRGATLIGANLSGTELRDAIFSNTYSPDGEEPYYRGT